MRVGTRRSALALAQARLVADLLGEDCELVEMSTSGDRGERAGDKSRWVGELERALLAREIDLAVHSAKDVPGEQLDGLELLGTPARAAAEDVLCGAASLDSLPHGARVGTSSIRRAAQLLAAREDLKIKALRGNVDTRLRRLEEPENELDAIVLARAGLERLGLVPEVLGTLEAARFVPAPGQGVLALQGRIEDGAVAARVGASSDGTTFACLRAERALAARLDASCNTPLGAHAWPGPDGELTLQAWLGLPDGSAWIGDRLQGPMLEPELLGQEVAERLSAVGAEEMLREAEAMANERPAASHPRDREAGLGS